MKHCESCEEFTIYEVEYPDEPTNYLCESHIDEESKELKLWKTGSKSINPIFQESKN